MNGKGVNRVFLVLIFVVMLAGAWTLGQRHGAREAFETAAERLDGDEALITISQLEVSLRQAEQQLLEAVSKTEAAVARTRELRDQLDEQMRKSESDTVDLALYRKIETSEKPASIDIDSLVWSASQPLKLELTLIQWQGRKRVKGELAVTLTYKGTTDGQSLSEEVKVDLEPVNFDFRFFQTFTMPMLSLNPVDAAPENKLFLAPEYVDVRVIPADERLGTLNTRFLWADVAQ